MAKRKVVCLCGSTRFYDEFQAANYRETMAGNIVLSVGFYPHASQQIVKVDGCMGEQESIVTVVHNEHTGCTPEEKFSLDELHFDKIDISDEVLVLNKVVIVCGKCGKPSRLFTELAGETNCCRSKQWARISYIGESTRNEINHAIKQGKPVRYLNPVGE